MNERIERLKTRAAVRAHLNAIRMEAANNPTEFPHIDATLRPAFDPNALAIATGLSQAKLAARLGVSIQTVRNWRRGKFEVPYTAMVCMQVLALRHAKSIKENQ